jgi:hypothetical protein
MHRCRFWLGEQNAPIDPDGQETHVSQGESTVLTGGVAYRLMFPQLTIYLLVEGPEKDQ